MTKELWINLPVKDVKKSREFFTKLGFSFRNRHADGEPMAAMLVGEKGTAVMLISEEMFKGFASHPVSDTAKGCEVLISFDAESRGEVDEMMRKAEEAGGTVYAKAGESQGWMYGGGFADLDGHRWNILYMDMSAMPKAGKA